MRGWWTLVLVVAASSSACCKLPSKSPEPVIKITAQKLYDDYDANEIAADKRYKGKALLVSGKVRDVSKNVLGGVTVNFNVASSTLGTVVANMKGSEKDKAATLRKGRATTLRCVGGMKALGCATLNDCTFYVY